MFKHSILSGASAAAILLATLSGASATFTPSPAEASMPVQAQSAWSGVWKTASDGGQSHDYLEFVQNGGKLTGLQWFKSSDGDARDLATLDIDQERSTAERLVGVWKAERQRAEFTLDRLPDGALKLVMVRNGRPGGVFLRRVSRVGEIPPLPDADATRQAMLGVWAAPFGHFKVSRDGERRLVALLTRAGGTTLLGRFDSREVRGERQIWSVGQSSDRQNEFQIVLSPDKNAFIAMPQDGAGEIDGLKYWEAARLSSTGQTPPSPATPPGTPAPPPATATPPPTPPQPPVPPTAPPVPQPTSPVPSQPTSQIPAGGTVQAGVFHQIAEYDVRLDELRVARDGKVHAFFTVKNRSGRDRDVHQGLLTMVLTDADGVGVRTSTPWRITGEEPTAFEGRPTIPNGGEFKLRFVLEPTRVHGPMRTLTVREGDTGKSLTFDASSTATRSELSSPPPAGGGAFKALSKFDVRIDRIAPARDGKLEAFLTLRNATRDVQSTTPSTIRLVGTDQDGAKRSSRSAHFSTRGERGVNDDLPILVYAEPGAEMRIRYVFDQAVTGAITITDDVVEQTFTPGQ